MIPKTKAPAGGFDPQTGKRLNPGGLFDPPDKCPKCRNAINAPLKNGNRCPACNRVVPQECKNCGTARVENASYCVSCGEGEFTGAALKKRVAKICPVCKTAGHNSERCQETVCIKPLMIGGRVPNGQSHYIVQKILGNGAMGIVYLVKDQNGNLAALKEIRPLDASSAMDPALLFQNEKQAMAWFRKIPEAVRPVAPAFEDGFARYILMEFIPGETFEQIVDRVNPRVAVQLSLQLTDAVSRAHNFAILRDLKSSNVMRLPGGKGIKLFDFGFVHMLNAGGYRFPPIILGTPGFGPPEQFGEKLLRSFARNTGNGHRLPLFLPTMDTDPKPHWDTYAIGAILYHHLTKTHPAEMLYGWEFGGIADHGLRQIVSKALSQDPSSRYQTATDLLSALRQV
ncbi:serine/threonine protein kinase [candidate division WWE3 bacterium]|jgi:serine/threonine protein kinase|nr:serine/threonine protein kinase [candidate division WWE3 bacterium]MBT7349813.1 serine/threonine protein kinase [candidate division WWE3 bacterium]